MVTAKTKNVNKYQEGTKISVFFKKLERIKLNSIVNDIELNLKMAQFPPVLT